MLVMLLEYIDAGREFSAIDHEVQDARHRRVAAARRFGSHQKICTFRFPYSVARLRTTHATHLPQLPNDPACLLAW